MREIKFRFWNTEKRKFEEFFYLSNSGEIINFDCNYAEVTPNIIASQYTGMKDKNAKEIYEGDIVCAKWKDELDYDEYKDSRPTSGEWKGEVCFDKSFYVIKQLNDDYSPNISDLCIVSMEIIGNIFENPELVSK